MIKHLGNLIIFFVFISYSGFAQEVQFSQLFADRMYLNPAYAGIDYCPRFLVEYRNQWPGVQFPYVTYNATFDKYVESLHGGIGLRIMKDDQGGGTFNQLSADLIYAYEAKIRDKMLLRFAFEASVFQQSTNFNDLVFSSMIDPAQGIIFPSGESFSQDKFISPDFSAGILFRYDKYFFGFSANHIPQNLVAGHNEYLPLKLTAHLGAIIPVFKNDPKQANFSFEPNIVFIKQQNLNMLYYGTYFDIKEMSFGLFYRQNIEFHFDALVASFHMRLKKMTIGYSYDVTLSKFIKQTLGAHELSLVYLIPCNKKIRNYNTISCPSF